MSEEANTQSTALPVSSEVSMARPDAAEAHQDTEVAPKSNKEGDKTTTASDAKGMYKAR